MAKRPVPKYDFKAFGAAIKAARTGRKESRKKVSDEMFISPRYLANIENKGQHLSLQIFFELMLRYNISVDQFLLETPPDLFFPSVCVHDYAYKKGAPASENASAPLSVSCIPFQYPKIPSNTPHTLHR